MVIQIKHASSSGLFFFFFLVLTSETLEIELSISGTFFLGLSLRKRTPVSAYNYVRL